MRHAAYPVLSSRSPHSQRAVTLVEVLAALSIMAVLIGILVPVIVAAKKRAKESSDINELHQLGLAGAMYNDQFGEYPTGTFPLVASGMAPTSICSGLVDPYPQGMANFFASDAQRHFGNSVSLVAPYRNSYIGPREFNLTMAALSKRLPAAQNVGWLVDWSSSAPLPFAGKLPFGRYFRLLDDSSVIAREMNGTPVATESGSGLRIYVADYFGDLRK